MRRYHTLKSSDPTHIVHHIACVPAHLESKKRKKLSLGLLSTLAGVLFLLLSLVLSLFLSPSVFMLVFLSSVSLPPTSWLYPTPIRGAFAGATHIQDEATATQEYSH